MASKPAQRVQQGRTDPIEERVQAIIEGREQAPTELCEYLVQAIKDAATEREDLVKRIQEAEQFLAQFRTRLAAVTGVLQKSHQDLRKKLTGDKPMLHPVESEEVENKEPDKEEAHETD